MVWKTNVLPLKLRLKGHNKYGTYVQNYPFIWINPGEPPELDAYAQGPGIYKLRSYNSVSTPLWDVPQTRYVRVRYPRKQYHAPKKPVRPILYLPSLPKIPTRRNGSENSWKRVLRRYHARVEKARLLRSRKMVEFHLRITKYNERLAIYEQRLKKFLAPRRLKFVRAGVIVNPQNNPFTYTKYETTGWNIDYKYQELYGTEVSGGYTMFFPSGSGKYVYREVAIQGIQESVPSIWYWDHPFPSMPSVTPPNSLINGATAKAIGKLYENIKDETVHIGNIVAERAQTYSMLTDSISRLKNFLHSPRKSVMDYLFESGFTKRVANDFIQYCFGVAPLANDVFTLTKKLQKSFEATEKDDIVKVKSTGTLKDKQESSFDGYFYTTRTVVEFEVKVKYSIQYKIDNPALSSLNDFGLINPAEVLWEVTPWSFVVDWFLPIGKYISSLSADQGLSFQTGTKSIYTKTTRTVTREYSTPEHLRRNYGQLWTGTIEKTDTTEYYERTVLSSPPVPGLPRFKSPFSTRHILLSLALWRQRV